MALQVLDVYLHNTFAGQLSYENGLLSFLYDSNYLGREIPHPLSASMPLRNAVFDHDITAAFFSGLLPEDLVRRRIARHLNISEKNTFALLKEIGGECAGAVSLYCEGLRPDTKSPDLYRVLEKEEALDILSHLDKRPMMVGDGEIRISGAGAQDKLIVALVDGKISIPLQNTPSTHIIKPNIQDLENTVYNEFFCMKLAGNTGLPVPGVQVFYLNEVPFYLVQRYDRIEKNDAGIVRLHQEDMCQALHIPPEQKYENEGGPSLKDCFTLLDGHIHEGFMAGVNKLTLFQGAVFNFLIGNGDAHGKNFSILYVEEGAALAPYYDLLCTTVYGDAYKSRMAMKLGGHYRFNEVAYRHIERLGTDVGFKASFVKTQVEKLSRKIRIAAPELMAELNAQNETASPIYEQIVDVINTHCQQIDASP